MQRVKLTNLPKFVENLKNLEVVNLTALKYSDLGMKVVLRKKFYLQKFKQA